MLQEKSSHTYLSNYIDQLKQSIKTIQKAKKVYDRLYDRLESKKGMCVCVRARACVQSVYTARKRKT